MGSGASTPVYKHRIEPSRTYRSRQVAPPLKPMYSSTILNDTVAVANQDRLFQKSPRNVSNLNNTQHRMRPMESATPSRMYQDYTFVREKNIPKSGYVIQGGGEYITKANVEKRKPQPFVIQDMSEYELQSNGFYKLVDSGTYLLPTGSGFLPDEDVNDHPFAPSSSDTSTASVSSDNNVQLRRTKKNIDRFYSSSSDGSLHSAPKVVRKGETGVVLNQVKKALEATPPSFLVVPKDGSTSRSVSPSPTIRSSHATKTMRAPPNSGDGDYRDEDILIRRHSNNPQNIQQRSPRHTLFHHHSSPELYRSKSRTVQQVGGSREDLRNTRQDDQHYKQNYSPAREKNLRFTGSVTRIDAPNTIDKNYLSPLTGAYDRSRDDASKDSSHGRPPHLTPSPHLSPRRKPREKSAVSTISVSPSIKSISRSPHQTPIKINNHGLVYI